MRADRRAVAGPAGRRRVDLARRPAPRASTSSTTPAARCRPVGRRPRVLTLHDLQPLEAQRHPLVASSARYLGRAVPRRACGPAVGWPCRASSCVARCSSGSTSPPERVVVIPHAVPVRPAGTPRGRPRRSATGSPGPVVLYPAITYPHKEHAHAARGLRAGPRPPPRRGARAPRRGGVERGAPSQAQIDASPRLPRAGAPARPDPRGRRRGPARAGRRRGRAVPLRGLRAPGPRGDGRGRRRSWPPTRPRSPRSSATPGGWCPSGDVGGLGRGDRRPPGRPERAGAPGRRRAARAPRYTTEANAARLRGAVPGAPPRPAERAAGPNGSARSPSCRVGDPMGKASSTRRCNGRRAPAAGCRPDSPAASCSRASSRWSWCSASPWSSTPATTASTTTSAACRSSSDHIHQAFGVNVCGEWKPDIPEFEIADRHPHPRRRRAPHPPALAARRGRQRHPRPLLRERPRRGRHRRRDLRHEARLPRRGHRGGRDQVRGRRGPAAAAGLLAGRVRRRGAAGDHHRRLQRPAPHRERRRHHDLLRRPRRRHPAAADRGQPRRARRRRRSGAVPPPESESSTTRAPAPERAPPPRPPATPPRPPRPATPRPPRLRSPHAGGRAGRRLRHPAAAAHPAHAEADAAGGQPADDRAGGRAPGRARRRRRPCWRWATGPTPSRPPTPTARCAGVDLHYAIEPEPRDTAGAIRFAALDAGIAERFLVLNGDVLTDLDLGALRGRARARRRRGHDRPAPRRGPVGLRRGPHRRRRPGRPPSSRSRRATRRPPTSSTPAPTCSSRRCSTGSRPTCR